MQLLNYYELSLTACEPIDENVEIISAYLGEFGFEGSAEDESIKAYKAENEITVDEINVLVTELIEKNLCYDDFKIEIIKSTSSILKTGLIGKLKTSLCIVSVIENDK